MLFEMKETDNTEYDMLILALGLRLSGRGLFL